MNVNQQPQMASPYGQPQSGYQGYPQSGYGGQQMPGGYAPYAPYNGPASNYQTGPPQGSCLNIQTDYIKITSSTETVHTPLLVKEC